MQTVKGVVAWKMRLSVINTIVFVFAPKLGASTQGRTACSSSAGRGFCKITGKYLGPLPWVDNRHNKLRAHLVVIKDQGTTGRSVIVERDCFGGM